MQHSTPVDMQKNNVKHTQKHKNTSSSTYKQDNFSTSLHTWIVVVQLLGMIHKLTHANREEDPKEIEIWTENWEMEAKKKGKWWERARVELNIWL